MTRATLYETLLLEIVGNGDMVRGLPYKSIPLAILLMQTLSLRL